MTIPPQRLLQNFPDTTGLGFRKGLERHYPDVR
jgi:hypothetical protein